MAILHNRERVSAKEKARILIREYLEDFDLEIEVEEEKLTSKEMIRIQDQVDKYFPKIHRVLMSKEEREVLKKEREEKKNAK